MAEVKTKATENSVEEYLMQINNETLRKDCKQICNLMKEVSKSKGKMWGTAIIGFGDYRYSYSTGRTGNWFMMGIRTYKK